MSGPGACQGALRLLRLTSAFHEVNLGDATDAEGSGTPMYVLHVGRPFPVYLSTIRPVQRFRTESSTLAIGVHFNVRRKLPVNFWINAGWTGSTLIGTRGAWYPRL